jgi:hypothetical protein
MAVHTRLVNVLLGSVLVALTVPLGVGPVGGGWLAARGNDGPARGALLGGVAGTLGAVPWAALVYAASAGRIGNVGYHEGWVHVGVNAAAPETFVLWQEVGLAALVAGVVVGTAVLGGIVAGLPTALRSVANGDPAELA